MTISLFCHYRTSNDPRNIGADGGVEDIAAIEWSTTTAGFADMTGAGTIITISKFLSRRTSVD
ncbi:MAG TPA: hypothetical protein DCK93_17660 [Blastocatellia bacterium]|jgi:hypothetical protein|nr:hypothetical protein [Blastocatellia bacterium]HAF24703.1 hypothetical protein [Blastocatellia bacterium]